MAIVTSAPVGRYPAPLTVALSSSIAGAFIRYTLDGSDPRTYQTLQYSAPLVLTQDTTIKAVEVTNVPDVDTAAQVYTLAFEVFPLTFDSDQDNIPDVVEIGPDPLNPVDTDGDGTQDYKDLDSNNDGIPDSVSGVLDRNNNGVPDYRDMNLVLPLEIYLEGLTTNQELVENVPVSFNIIVKSGSGKLAIIPNDTFILWYPQPPVGAVDVKAWQAIPYTIMPSVCRNKDLTHLTFVYKDDLDGTETTITIDLTIVKSNADYPIKGVKITWKKVYGAIAYHLYKKDEADLQMLPLVIVPHDASTYYTYQWYIDRNGLPTTKYAIAAIDVNGVEGVMTLPRHAPDIPTNVCLVQGNVSDLGMIPLENIAVYCRLKEAPTILGNTVIVKGSQMLWTDARGYFEFRVPQGCIITFSVDDAGFKRNLIVPYKTSMDIKELLAMPQNTL